MTPHVDHMPSWSAMSPGDVLAEVVLEVTEQTVILVPVSTWDLFPGHYSVAYATAQGQEDIYLNTIALQGVVDRTVTDSLGPSSWITRRRMRMLGSVYPGDQLRGAARVVDVKRDPPAHGVSEAEFEVEMFTERGRVLRANVTARQFVRRHEGDESR